MSIFLIVYLIGFLLTSIYAGWQSGREQAYMHALKPQPYTLNGANNLLCALVWPGFWACIVARKRAGTPTESEALAGLGLPPK